MGLHRAPHPRQVIMLGGPRRTGARGQPIAGFTLLELLVAMALLGILTAIAAPSWVTFVQRARLEAVNDAVARSLRETQARARQTHRDWEWCFRDRAGRLEYAQHPVGVANCTTALWRSLGQELDFRVEVDPDHSTFFLQGTAYRMRFKRDGAASGRLGRVTFRPNGGGLDFKSCTFVSTLLGAVRLDRDRRCLRSRDPQELASPVV